MNKFDEAYDFDDVLIKPIPSFVSSRDDVDISVRLSEKLKLNFPLIVSPMPETVNAYFAKLISNLGGLAILHRFYSDKFYLYQDIEDNLNINDDKFGLSLKVGDEEFADLLSYNPDILLVDTANGYNPKLLEYCERLKNYISTAGLETLLMAGNVATQEGCINLYNSGCDLIRVGIGGGSVCSTRNKTGIGIPNISALIDCSDLGYYSGKMKLVIDGGIKSSGDFVKSIVAGADLGMASLLFAQCFEAPNDGTLSGGASLTHMERMHINVKSVEGFDIKIEKKYSLENFVREFGYGIKSAGTYLNARTLDEIYLNGEFIKVSDSAIKKGIL